MEQDLPVPREDLFASDEDKDDDENKVFRLPDLGSFMKETTDRGVGGDERRTRYTQDASKPIVEDVSEKIDRSNREEYIRVMQLNPFADADESMFTDEYDMFPSVFGSGKLLYIPVPYLQTGHGILLITASLAGYIYAPGNPLTEFPPEIRSFLREGLTVVYSINTVLAVQAFFNAKAKNLPGIFWALKTFILGGVAYYEITQAKDPNIKPNPSDRKADRSKIGNNYEDKFR